MELSDDGREAYQQIQRLRDEGALFAQLEGRRYVLMGYELYPNGTTSPTPIEDPDVARQIGERSGLGAPTDRQGWAIWEVPEGT